MYLYGNNPSNPFDAEEKIPFQNPIITIRKIHPAYPSKLC